MPDIFVPEEDGKEKAPQGKTTLQQDVVEKRADEMLAKHMPQIHPVGFLSSFIEHPGGISFQDQENGEVVLLFLRRHFITNLSWIIPSLLLLLAPALVALFFALFGQELFEPFSFPPQYIFIFLLFYYLVIFGFIFVSFISWFYNVGLVTKRRIVDIDYSDVVYRNVAMTRLMLIEDVNYTQTGFIRSLFNYGDVRVQTAGNNPNFEFMAVPQPAKATHIIEDLLGGGQNV